MFDPWFETPPTDSRLARNPACHVFLAFGPVNKVIGDYTAEHALRCTTRRTDEDYKPVKYKSSSDMGGTETWTSIIMERIFFCGPHGSQ